MLLFFFVGLSRDGASSSLLLAGSPARAIGASREWPRDNDCDGDCEEVCEEERELLLEERSRKGSGEARLPRGAPKGSKVPFPAVLPAGARAGTACRQRPRGCGGLPKYGTCSTLSLRAMQEGYKYTSNETPRRPGGRGAETAGCGIQNKAILAKRSQIRSKKKGGGQKGGLGLLVFGP
jgi:hypothetical protein